MNAKQKQHAVEAAIAELKEADDLDDVARIVEKGYEAARGSNDRKEMLWAAEKAAKERIAHDQICTGAACDCPNQPDPAVMR